MHVPIIPRDRAFKKRLREELMKDNPYTAHWVDSAIRTAYSIMEPWRKRYLKGVARKVKLRIRRRFAKCKTTLIKIDC
jgi:putative transposase